MTVERAADAPAGPAAPGDWLEREIAALRERADRLERELETARVARRQAEAVAERVDGEAARWRERHGALRREGQRDRAAAESAAAVLEALAERVRALERRGEAEAQAARRHAEAEAAERRGGERLAERVEAAESRMAALSEAWTASREARERLEAALPEAASAIERLQAGQTALRDELRRVGGDLARERARRDREDELAGLTEQHRSARQRTERGLAVFGERLDAAARALDEAAEERAALAGRLARAEEGLRALGEELEAQRATAIEHFRRVTEAQQASARRRVAEIERGVREGRALLGRLREAADLDADPAPGERAEDERAAGGGGRAAGEQGGGESSP